MYIKIAHDFRLDFEKKFKQHHVNINDLVHALKKTSYIGLESPIAKV